MNQNGSLYGYNTDMPGFLYMVKKNGINMEGKKVVVLEMVVPLRQFRQVSKKNESR